MRQTLLQFEQGRTRHTPSKKASWLGSLAGLAACLPRRSRSTITGSDLKKYDFATSTQRLGVRFTERIRAAFRFRWLSRL